MDDRGEKYIREPTHAAAAVLGPWPETAPKYTLAHIQRPQHARPARPRLGGNTVYLSGDKVPGSSVCVCVSSPKYFSHRGRRRGAHRGVSACGAPRPHSRFRPCAVCVCVCACRWAFKTGPCPSLHWQCSQDSSLCGCHCGEQELDTTPLPAARSRWPESAQTGLYLTLVDFRFVVSVFAAPFRRFRRALCGICPARRAY